MPILHAIVLGIVQGFTEFLPISSSGHLIVVPWLLGWDDLDDASIQKAFDVALHIGTLLAVISYFWRDLGVLIRQGLRAAFVRREPATREGRLAWLLLLSAIPAAVVGAGFTDVIEEELGSIPIVALSLIAFGALLWYADNQGGKGTVDDYGAREALLMGAAQALSLNPGTSRSGITMTAGRLLHFSRDAAARLSFLMAIPVTGGAVLYKVGGLVLDGVPEDLVAPMLAGIAASAVAGWVAVWGTLRIVRTHSFFPFVVYRFVVGGLLLVVWLAR